MIIIFLFLCFLGKERQGLSSALSAIEQATKSVDGFPLVLDQVLEVQSQLREEHWGSRKPAASSSTGNLDIRRWKPNILLFGI